MHFLTQNKSLIFLSHFCLSLISTRVYTKYTMRVVSVCRNSGKKMRDWITNACKVPDCIVEPYVNGDQKRCDETTASENENPIENIWARCQIICLVLIWAMTYAAGCFMLHTRMATKQQSTNAFFTTFSMGFRRFLVRL